MDVRESRFADYVKGACVLVTGAGGSLGAQLCRRLVTLGVDELVLLDQGEGALVDVVHQLRYDAGFTRASATLADLRNAARVREILIEHRPAIVFHTAAYKQVPLVEAHPIEAIANNVLATSALVDAVDVAEVGRFVLYSTDKAIRPRSLLGQTKAAAECIVGTVGRRSTTLFACIRLGNVVDSAGSMLPLFRRQIAHRQPVTITHPKMTRYLMTAGEATGLAIVAGALARSGDVFRLNMGHPVRILEAARAVLDAAGSDIPVPEVEFIGRRPGEKLHEDLDEPGQTVWRTNHEQIFRSPARSADAAWLEARLRRIATHVADADAAAARAELADLVVGARGAAAVSSTGTV